MPAPRRRARARARAAGTASRAPAAPRARPARTAATSTRVLGGTRIPAARASVAASLPISSDVDAAVGIERVAHARRLARRSSTWAPCALSSRSKASATRSSTIATDSLVHRIELSNALESARRSAAAATSAVAIDQRRHVAGADADRRVARAVGGANDRGAAGGHDHVGAGVGHQRLDQRDRRLLDHLQAAVGRARRDRGLGESTRTASAAPRGRAGAGRRRPRCGSSAPAAP